METISQLAIPLGLIVVVFVILILIENKELKAKAQERGEEPAPRETQPDSTTAQTTPDTNEFSKPHHTHDDIKANRAHLAAKEATLNTLSNKLHTLQHHLAAKEAALEKREAQHNRHIETNPSELEQLHHLRNALNAREADLAAREAQLVGKVAASPQQSSTPTKTPVTPHVTPPTYDDDNAPYDCHTYDNNPQALHALRLLNNTQEPLVITGSAGTGKTTLINTWRKAAKPVVVAYTGIAAIQANGQTIHSFFEFAPKEPITEKYIRSLDEPRQPLKELHTLVIDEVSMVRADLMSAIELRLRLHGPNPGTPWGGVRIVLVGDMYQLPPIVPKELATHFTQSHREKIYDSPWWWGCKAAKATPWKVIELQKIYRQSDVKFISLLQRIRKGQALPEDLQTLDTQIAKEAPNTIRLVCRNTTADNLNKKRLSTLKGKEHSFHASVAGDEEYINSIKLPAPRHLCLKAGARIMMVCNETQAKRWVNGDTGTINAIGHDYVDLTLDRYPSPIYRVKSHKWNLKGYRYNEDKKEWEDYEKATYEQLPMTLGWARTIHKSQGQSYAHVHVNLEGGAFAPGMTYVALSRSRTLKGLTLEKEIRNADIHCDIQADLWMREHTDKVKESALERM